MPGATGAAAPPGAGATTGSRARTRQCGSQHARDHELELQARGGRPGHVVERRDHQVGDVREARRAESAGLARHPLEVLRGHTAQHGGRSLTRRADDDEVAQALEQVVDEPPRVLPGLDHPVDRSEGR